MARNLSVHDQLLNWRKDLIDGKLCISSVLLPNKNIPLFEEDYGFLDYDWFLKVTKDRKCIFTEPTVIRYVNENNLSRNPRYRSAEFIMNLYHVNPSAFKRLYSTQARYFYSIGDMDRARFWFKRGNINLKTIMYYITSYLPISKYICKKFRVMT